MAKCSKPSVGRKGSAPPVSSSGKPVLHYWSGGHTRHRVLDHFVFCPKYRHRVLEGAIASRLEELFRECCEMQRWYLHELNIQPDHVHLLVQFSPSELICDVAQSLKGGSSITIRSEFPDLREFLWGAAFWSEGYFCESVGYRDEAAVRRYIRDQDKIVVSEKNEELSLGFDGQP